MIKKYSLKALEKAVNHALRLDENTPGKIEVLHGKVIEIIIAPLDINFYVTFEQHQLKLLDQYSEPPHTIIHSNPLGLIRLSILPASRARSLFNDKIRISGDIELGQQVKNLFDELDIDWEGHLAHFTGDVAAYQLGSLVRKGMAFKQRLAQSLSYNLTGYLQEEMRFFPAREEIEDFFSDIDKLTLDVERLQAQINLLLAGHENI